MAKQFVLDCSVAASWFFEDESSGYQEMVLHRLEKEAAVVPAIWSLEITNVLVMAVRKNRLDEVKLMPILQVLADLPIYIDYETPDQRYESFKAKEKAA